jgi:nitrate reductase / nitrite oxidoreductase, beta subunit
VPPLSPVSSRAAPSGEAELIDRLRIPVAYLANLLTAGDEAPVRTALKRLAAVRRYMRTKRLEKRIDTGALEEAGLDADTVEKMYRLLALGRLEDRFVLPTAPVQDERHYTCQGGCGYDGAL